MSDDIVTVSGWIKGIGLSILASIVGGASKLAIRKSWIMEEESISMTPTRQSQLLLPASPHDEEETDHHYHHSSEYVCLSDDGSVASNDDHDNENDGEGIDNHSDQDHQNSSKRIRKRALCLRISGMLGMTILNPLCCVLAMNFASPSILAPFSGLTLVWVVLFSTSLIGETPLPTQVMASAMVVLGEVFVALFGDHTNDDDVTLEQLVCLRCFGCGTIVL